MRKSDHSAREELRRMNGLLCNVLDEMKRLSASFQETKEKGFTIEDSVYKVRPNAVQSCVSSRSSTNFTFLNSTEQFSW